MEIKSHIDAHTNQRSITAYFTDQTLHLYAEEAIKRTIEDIAKALTEEGLIYVRQHIDWNKVKDAAEAALIKQVTAEARIGSYYDGRPSRY